MRDIVNKKFECITENTHNKFQKNLNTIHRDFYVNLEKNFKIMILEEFRMGLKIMNRGKFVTVVKNQVQSNLTDLKFKS